MSEYLYSVDDNSEELMHYGVLGMKWHHRKAGIANAKASFYRIAETSPYHDNYKRNYYHKLADKAETKRDKHLAKNNENLSKNPNIKKGERYTKLNKDDKVKGGLRYAGRLVGGTAAAAIAGSVAVNGAYKYSSARKAGYSRKQSLKAGVDGLKEGYNVYSKAAVKAGKNVKNAAQSVKRQAKRTVYNSKIAKKRRRNKFADKYGLPGVDF